MKKLRIQDKALHPLVRFGIRTFACSRLPGKSQEFARHVTAL